MGIKGIYKELGPGKRVALSKLTADSFEHLGRPLRLAIDVAIWQFQTQAAKGGTNPAIRTLFYRLTRLQSTPIQPIFVFDGPHKPKIKRNKRSGRGDGVATAQAKRLIRLFGFAVHDAPGEAEAECALLQRHGIVDAVLSEDVDTIMFGCTKTLRSWSGEGKTGKGGTPTHVTIYDVDEIKEAGLGLDREGMVLVALMSGGDYLPDGIPGCGVKVAVEAARAGFGKSLCRLKNADTNGIAAWRANLAHEIRTNASGHFRCKHQALTIPEDFPDMEVLRLYTHPVVTRAADLDSVKHSFEKKRDIEVQGLREFGRETFDWDFRLGAIKFIRVISQSVLLRQMLHDPARAEGLITKISGQRSHLSTGESSELRVSYIPGNVVPVDLSLEVKESISAGREGLALDEDHEDIGALEEDIPAADSTGKVFDVTKPELIWVLESLARVAVPRLVASWDVEQAAKVTKKAKSPAKRKISTRPKKADARTGAMDAFVKVTKAAQPVPPKPVMPAQGKTPPRPQRSTLTRPRTPTLPDDPTSKPSTPCTASSLVRRADKWSIGSSLSPSPRAFNARGTSPRFLSTYPSFPLPDSGTGQRPKLQHPETIILSSSPPACPSPRRRRKQGIDEVPDSIRTILESDQSSVMGQTGSSPVSSAARSPSYSMRRDPMRQKIAGGRMKQTTMEAFMRSARGRNGLDGLRASEQSRGTDTEDPFVDEPIVLSASPASMRERTSPGCTRPSTPPLSSTAGITDSSSPHSTKRGSHDETPGLTTTPTKKKKTLLVPRVSAGGFFSTIEVEEGEVEQRIAREQEKLDREGKGSRVMRRSDVGLIDLTELD